MSFTCKKKHIDVTAGVPSSCSEAQSGGLLLSALYFSAEASQPSSHSKSLKAGQAEFETLSWKKTCDMRDKALDYIEMHLEGLGGRNG